MQRRFICAAALLCAAAAHAQSDLPIHSRKLANGLEVIVIENHAVSLVTVEIDVRFAVIGNPDKINRTLITSF